MDMWTADQLIEIAKETKEIEFQGEKIIIRKLSAKEVRLNADAPVKLLSLSLVEPNMTVAQIDELSMDIMNPLMEEVMKLNGMDIDEDDEPGN